MGSSGTGWRAGRDHVLESRRLGDVHRWLHELGYQLLHDEFVAEGDGGHHLAVTRIVDAPLRP